MFGWLRSGTCRTTSVLASHAILLAACLTVRFDSWHACDAFETIFSTEVFRLHTELNHPLFDFRRLSYCIILVSDVILLPYIHLLVYEQIN
jgi:hypothetical protein